MPRSPLTFAGLKIVTSPNWPRKRVEDQTVRFPAHSFVIWLARWFPITPYVEATFPRYRDADPLIDERHGIVYCSPAQADELKRAFRQRDHG